MPWYSKEQPTPFDAAEIPGLVFLHGDILARRYRQTWIEGKKYPLISFPSGVKREVHASEIDPDGAVHIFDQVTLGYHCNRDEAYLQAIAYVGEHSYVVSLVGEDTLEIAYPYAKRTYELTFDNTDRQLVNVVVHPYDAMELLGGESRALLPPLYHNEKNGLDAVAPLKFFTPDSGWIWYPSEFDGDDIFFGLVSGLEVELGYFSLSELEGVHGALGLPIERDLYFKPTSLKDLIDLHKRRGY